MSGKTLFVNFYRCETQTACLGCNTQPVIGDVEFTEDCKAFNWKTQADAPARFYVRR